MVPADRHDATSDSWIPGEDHLINFQLQGKRSYYLASTLEDGDAGPVLRRLSDQFELCAFGLSRVRREWEKFETDPPGQGPSAPRFVV